MKHGSLFTGIGGFDLAAEWVGWENVFQVEIDEKCQRLLEQNFPNVKRFRNIKDFDGTKFRGAIDILSGGPPCQPASQAGKRKGEADDRWLWPETIRVFGDVRPTVGVFENPDDLLTLDNGEPFERICNSLENFGYKVETYGIPAACVGAWHERNRIWIVAYSNNIHDKRKLDNGRAEREATGNKKAHNREGETLDGQRLWIESGSETSIIPNSYTSGLSQSAQRKFTGIFKENGTPARSMPGGTHAESWRYWEIEPGVGRMVHGLPNRVDRIKGLGNAIVPQVAYQIFKAIEQCENL